MHETITEYQISVHLSSSVPDGINEPLFSVELKNKVALGIVLRHNLSTLNKETF